MYLDAANYSYAKEIRDILTKMKRKMNFIIVNCQRNFIGNYLLKMHLALGVRTDLLR
jgi:hypothetical protein